MDPNSHTDAGVAFSWLAAANTGMGILLMAGFPFAVPLLLLAAACAVPLLLLAIPLAVPVGLVLLVRRIARGVAARAANRRLQASQARQRRNMSPPLPS